jgi:hypothetical protein
METESRPLEKQVLTLKQTLMLAFRLCEARMRQPNQPFASRREVESEIDALLSRVEIEGCISSKSANTPAA